MDCFVKLKCASKIAPAAATLCKMLSMVLKGFQAILHYLDDILVHGSTLQVHDSNSMAMLHKLHDTGLELNANKMHLPGQRPAFLGSYDISQGCQASRRHCESYC